MKKIIIGFLTLMAVSAFASEEKTIYGCTDMYNNENVTLIETVIREIESTTHLFEIDNVVAGCQAADCSVLVSYSNKKDVKVHAVEFEKCKKLKTLPRY